MSNLPDYTYRILPPDVQFDLDNLPNEARHEFLAEYNHHEKKLGLAYLFHFIFGLSYGYQDKWVKQILFWLSGYGFGIWWFVQLFRLPMSIRQANRKIGRTILTRIKRKYARFADPLGFKRKNFKSEPFAKAFEELQPKPRKVEVDFDPSSLTVDNLKVGGLVDYQLTTWTVLQELQFDWNDGRTEREFKLEADLAEVYLAFPTANRERQCFLFHAVNIHAIDPELQTIILHTRQPKNIIELQGVTYFREQAEQGNLFGISPAERPKKAVRWAFFDAGRAECLRIELLGEKEFRCLKGKRVPEYDFSDILPPSMGG